MGGPLSAGIRVDAVENVWQARGIIGRKVAAGGGGRKLVGEKAFTVAPRTLNWNALEAETERVLQKFEALASELAAPTGPIIKDRYYPEFHFLQPGQEADELESNYLP